MSNEGCYYKKLKFNLMKKNIGTLDKAIRILIALVVITLYVTHVLSGTLAIVLLILSGILIVTSLLGFCPIYFPFGIQTTKKKNKR